MNCKLTLTSFDSDSFEILFMLSNYLCVCLLNVLIKSIISVGYKLSLTFI